MSLWTIELVITIIAVAVALLCPFLGARWLEQAERGFVKIARNQRTAIAIVFLIAIVGRVLLLPVSPVPNPVVHDEFSYLLQADTFANGRITNATHPLWKHFESFHINQRPTYASMYPPGQGLMLLAGRLLFHSEWAGVLVCVSAMCAGICWALQPWFGPTWAMLAGLLAIIRLAWFSYWGNSYWGGALAGFAGVLLIGLIPRIRVHPRRIHGLFFAIALVILANSRPYEGACLAAATTGIVGYRAFRDRTLADLRECAVTAALVLSVGVTATGFYNWKVFGRPTSLAYAVNRAQYASAGIFVWESPKPSPVYRHAAMRDFYERWELNHFRSVRTLSGYFQTLNERVLSIAVFFSGWIFAPVLTFAFLGFEGERRWLLALLAVGTVASCAVAWMSMHYIAPYVAALYAVIIEGFLQLRRSGLLERSRAIALSRLLVLACIALALTRVAAPMLGLNIDPGAVSWFATPGRDVDRPGVARLLDPNKNHVILVRYSHDHNSHNEWVYNGSDIDHQWIIWARDMGNDNNRDIVSYYPTRCIWLFGADTIPYELRPYGGSCRSRFPTNIANVRLARSSAGVMSEGDR